jgi:trehalose 6-phosphate synthase/phosphatase
VLVSMSNVSIEPRMVDAVLMLPSVQAGKEALQAKHKGRMIIGGVDIGQRLSGTALKLLAYERLLQDYPSWQHGVVMVERLLLPGSRKADEDLTSKEVRALVQRIQEKFGPDVIDYQELSGSGLPMDQRLALWKASDVMMMTPVREGLNHWPMEYIFSHKEPETPGVVITSEFSAVSSILNGALRVNPYDIPMAIVTIDKALSMSMQDRENRRYRDIDFVSKSPSDKWVRNVLRDLRDATSRREQSESNSQVSTPYATPTPSRSYGLVNSTTAAFLARESDLAFSHLNLNGMKRAYDASQRRVIILDFNGTIVLKEPPGKYLKREILGTSGNRPPPEVLDALSQLSQDPRNLIYVVSGDSAENVLNALGPLKGIGLAVSNGARFSPPLPSGETEREWFTFDLGVDWDAVKRVALPVLSKYTARSNGSFVKLTSFSIGWSYYSCDPEWGSLQASHLVMELESELRAFDVRFVTLKGIVEVVPRKLNKGLIAKQILRDTEACSPEHGVDFVLCVGDDISDEKMFTSVFSFLAEKGDESNSKPGPPVMKEDGSIVAPLQMGNSSPSAMEVPMHSFTVAVGKKPTHASVWVEDAQEVANALVLLVRGQIPQGGVPVWGAGSTPRMFEG